MVLAGHLARLIFATPAMLECHRVVMLLLENSVALDGFKGARRANPPVKPLQKAFLIHLESTFF
ncbi:MAG: hypothetical protein RIT27_771 [Pseudomonadota bacterium]